MTRFVFDTGPLFAFLYEEAGHDEVSTYLTDVANGNGEGFLSRATASELFYLIARMEAPDGEPTSDSFRIAKRDVRGLARNGLSIEQAAWETVGRVKARGGLSLGDAHAVALASDRDATLVVGGDDDFDALPVDVSVERFRNHGV